MIVFTATNQATREVYVGSARDNLEEHWAKLIVQAEDGGSGEFLDVIREYGAEQIDIEMWAYADSLAESRELVRDACDAFNAKLIKTGRAPAPAVSEAHTPKAQNTVKSSSPGTAHLNNVSPIHVSTGKTKQALHEAASANTKGKSEQDKISTKREMQKQHGEVTKIDIKAYLAQQAQAKVSNDEGEEAVTLRKTESTKVAEDMKAVMMRIEMKRKQNRGGSSTTKSKVTKTSTSKTSTLKVSPKTSPTTKKDRLPEGRVSSSAKEKKIKEAIAQERMEREAAHNAKASAEAKEMAELMARLDERSKEKAKIHRRR